MLYFYLFDLLSFGFSVCSDMFASLRAHVHGYSGLTLDSSLGASGRAQRDLVSLLVPPVLDSKPLRGIGAPSDLRILGFGPFRGLFCLNAYRSRRSISVYERTCRSRRSVDRTPAPGGAFTLSLCESFLIERLRRWAF